MTEKKGWRRILSLMVESPLWMVGTVLFALISSVAFFVPYWAIGGLLKEFFSDTMDKAYVLSRGSLAFVGAAVHIIGYFASLSCAHMAAFELEKNLKTEAAEALAKLPMGVPLSMGQGKLVHLIDDTAKDAQSFVAHEITEILLSVGMPAVMLFLMFQTDWRYAAMNCILLVVMERFLVLSNGPGGASEMMNVYLSALDRLHNETIEYVRGIREIRLYGEGEKRSRSLHKAIQEYTKVCIPYTIIWEKYRSIFSGLIYSFYLFLVPVAAVVLRQEHGTDAVASFLYFLLLSTSVVVLIPKLEGLTNDYLRISESLEHLDAVLYAEKMPEKGAEKEPLDASVAFREVDFSYPNTEKKALDGISFEAKAGTMTAIVGSSGSGKSTLLQLLARFYDVENGRIKIGGVDIREMSQEMLMNQIACVFQTPYLFQGSIEENIRGGRAGATKEEVCRAAELAGCRGFIEKLPNGYETVLKKDGKLLSGGEMQRLAIARAILKDAPIVLLDEVTSAADPENELQIRMAIRKLTEGKTVLMVAHRLSSVKEAEQILVLEDGKILERGQHAELMEKGGRYRQLWNAYTEVLNWKIGRRTKG